MATLILDRRRLRGVDLPYDDGEPLESDWHLDTQALRGWRLDPKGRYVEQALNERGWLWSEQLKLWLGVEPYAFTELSVKPTGSLVGYKRM